MWHFLSCEVIGRGHEKKEIPCQDKTYKFQYNGASVIALADGAGSAKCHILEHLVLQNLSVKTSQRNLIYISTIKME